MPNFVLKIVTRITPQSQLGQVAMGWIRHSLTTLAGAGVAKGFYDVNTEEAGVSLLLALVALVWSAADKYVDGSVGKLPPSAPPV